MEGHCETDPCGLSVDPQHLARRNRNDDFIDREGGVGARLADWNAWWGKSPRSDRRAFFPALLSTLSSTFQARSANRSSPMLCIRAICRMHPLRSAPTAATYRCSPMPSKNSISPPMSSSSARAIAWRKAWVVPPDAYHLCYCHTPMRYAWDQEHTYFPQRRGLKARFRAWILHRLRNWDAASSPRVDLFVANSPLSAGEFDVSTVGGPRSLLLR